MKIYSWNVNGIRAVLKKGALQSFLENIRPDILCLQETKAKPSQAAVDFPDYTELWHSAARPGYSGTAIFAKTPPLAAFNGFTEDLQIAHPWEEDPYGNPLSEGRLQTAEFQDFYLVNTYVPNTKHDLSRLPLREHIWDPSLLQYLKNLEKHKPVIICGDFNAAHTPIDLARPKDNENNAGYTPAERQGITNLLDAGFVDTFRHLHPNDQKYTWWTWRARARERNIGWRIDYFFISKSLLPRLQSADIYNDITGSDHCPISITMKGLR